MSDPATAVDPVSPVTAVSPAAPSASPAGVDTYTATIHVGLRVGYTDRTRLMGTARTVVRDYVNLVGLCVSLTETTYYYTQAPATPHGYDDGLMVGLINYPRFPSTPEQIREHARTLGGLLKAALGQNRVTVVCPDVTFMIGEA